jgi:two-component system, NarL family, response regulator DesR
MIPPFGGGDPERSLWQTETVQRPRPPRDRTRIVIADKDRRFADELRRSVEAHGAFEVVGIAGDGEEAIKLVETLKPSLVLMEVEMPGLDGVEVSRRLRDMSESPSVVLMTTVEGPDSRALNAGAAAYLRKGEAASCIAEIVLSLAQLTAIVPSAGVR